MRPLRTAAVPAALLAAACAAAAPDAAPRNPFLPAQLGAELGGGDGLTVYRVWLRWPGREALLGDPGGWHLDLAWQGAYTYLDCNDCDDGSHVISAAPVFRIVPPQRWLPFADISIGVSLNSEKEINGRRLGGRFQFEDVLGLGWWLGKQKRWELTVRAMHYSNARLYDDNDGVTVATLSLGYLY